MESGNNSFSVNESHTISANSGGSRSTITTDHSFGYTTSGGNSFAAESSSVRTTEGRSYYSAPTTDYSSSRTETSAVYGYGDLTVETASGSSTYKTDGIRVDTTQNELVAQTDSAYLEVQEQSVEVAKSNQLPEVLQNADFKVEELVLAKDEVSTSASVSAWGNENMSALNAEAHASAGTSIGTEGFKAHADAGASVSAFQANGSVTYGGVTAEGKVTVLGAEAHANAGVKVGADGVEASVKVGASVTVAEASGKVKVGDGNLGLQLGADGKVLSASAEAGAKIGYSKNEKTGEYELNAYVSLEVNAVVAEGNVSANFSVAGVDLGVKAGVYIGVGARVNIGIQDGKFVFDISAALGIGFNLKFSIGFNDKFLKNIRDIMAAPGVRYVRENPSFRVDTGKLRGYADRIGIVTHRLNALNDDLRDLYWQVGLLDVIDIVAARLLTGGNASLSPIKRYLNDTADRFDRAERKAREIMGG